MDLFPACPRRSESEGCLQGNGAGQCGGSGLGDLHLNLTHRAHLNVVHRTHSLIPVPFVVYMRTPGRPACDRLANSRSTSHVGLGGPSIPSRFLGHASQRYSTLCYVDSSKEGLVRSGPLLVQVVGSSVPNQRSTSGGFLSYLGICSMLLLSSDRTRPSHLSAANIRPWEVRAAVDHFNHSALSLPIRGTSQRWQPPVFFLVITHTLDLG